MIVLNNIKIDRTSIEIDGVDLQDFPKFCDAYISFATFEDGKELTDNELEQLTDENFDLVNEMSHEQFFG
jgi:hypothetical protein